MRKALGSIPSVSMIRDGACQVRSLRHVIEGVLAEGADWLNNAPAGPYAIASARPGAVPLDARERFGVYCGHVVSLPDAHRV